MFACQSILDVARLARLLFRQRVLLACFEMCPLDIRAHLLSDTRRILWNTWIAECPQRVYLGNAIFLKPFMDFIKNAAKAPRASSESPAGEGGDSQPDDAPAARASPIPALA